MTTIEVKTTVDTSNVAHMAALTLFLQSISEGENNATQDAKTTQNAEQPKAKTKTAKGKTKTAKTEADTTEPEVEPDENEEPAKPKEAKAKKTKKGEGPSIEDVRALLAQKVGDHRAAIKAKLGELGAKSVTLLNQGDYAEFMDFLNDL